MANDSAGSLERKREPVRVNRARRASDGCGVTRTGRDYFHRLRFGRPIPDESERTSCQRPGRGSERLTEQQSALLKKARDSLRGAEVLTREVLYDIAVSRAYYAMFYCAEALLDAEGLSFSSHAAVLSAFGQRFAKTGRVPPSITAT